MSDPFVMEGPLVLVWEPGYDGFYVVVDSVAEDLADLVASHFGVERELPSGNRNIGRVRVTVERLEEVR